MVNSFAKVWDHGSNEVMIWLWFYDSFQNMTKPQKILGMCTNIVYYTTHYYKCISHVTFQFLFMVHYLKTWNSFVKYHSQSGNQMKRLMSGELVLHFLFKFFLNFGNMWNDYFIPCSVFLTIFIIYLKAIVSTWEQKAVISSHVPG